MQALAKAIKMEAMYVHACRCDYLCSRTAFERMFELAELFMEHPPHSS